MTIRNAGDFTFTIEKYLSMRALGAARAQPRLLNLCNQYSLEGTNATKLSLSRFDDIGPADSIGLDVEYTGAAAFGSTAVDITPTRFAKGGTVDMDTYIRRGVSVDQVRDAMNGLSMAITLDDGVILSDEATSILGVLETAFGEELRQTAGSLVVSAEAAVIADMAGFSQTAGVTNEVLTITKIDLGLAELEGVTLPHDDIFIMLHPKAVSDLRADSRSGTTNGGFTDDLTTLLRYSAGIETRGLRGVVQGVPVYSYSPELTLYANGTTDVVGMIGLRGVGNPEAPGGSGIPGALAFCVGHAPVFLGLMHPNAFGVRFTMSQPQVSAERVDTWGVQVISKA